MDMRPYTPYQVLKHIRFEDMTPEERERAVRIAAIPPLVVKALEHRMEELLHQVMELEQERDAICDFLNGELAKEE